ncbi:MAG: DegV family EDD domain-containing protein [Lachnospiraceae bacterium]|nr:DegV family EDD domain-containing protein [Lachnospiraceae bacterium]
MWKKIIRQISGEGCELRERMFRIIILIAAVASVIGVGEIFLVMEITKVLLPFLALLFTVMAGSLIATFKYRKIDLAAMLLGIVIIIFVFPIMFCLSGGLEGGAPVWMALGLLYIFVMFSGKKLLFFLGLCIVSYGVTYFVTFWEPDFIVPMLNSGRAHVDSFFSVIVVGIVAGGILKEHMCVFEEEHRQNEEQKQALEKSSGNKSTFFAHMSHEIRTPINAIIGLDEMIMRSNPTDEIREYAKDIQVASKMLLNQVNDILDLSQMEMHKMKIVPVQYRTDILFGELAELMRAQMEKKSLEFYLDIDKNIPSVLYGDEKRIKQVLLNILDNAVKYTEEGSVTMSAQGEESSTGEMILKIKIADTGMGIRKEDIEYLYDSFNRADEIRNAKIVGSGLGLAITKQLVDLMGGEITVDSIYTKGTIFTVILKQKIVDSEPVGNVNAVKRERNEEQFYRPLFEAPEARILVVDDNKMNSLVASSLLSATKVQVNVAQSGEECLELTRKKFYHAILVDYMMPDMDGAETLKKIRTQENGLCREAAIIVLTGNAQSGARQMYMEEGFDGYVEKPIEGKLLEMELLQVLPSDIIEYLETGTVEVENDNQIQKLTRKKRKKIYITADCVCDVPPELLEKYDIKLMYLYIKTPHGRFADTREIDSDSLTQYISAESSTAYADSVTVEEYEEFFAETLTEAERVIHISVTSKSARSYGIAVTAAKGFDHVRVIDSGQISCGQGLIVLYAAKLAMEGKSTDTICQALEEMMGRIQTRFIMPGADIFFQNGRTRAITAKVCRLFNLHPFAGVRQKKVVLVGLLAGNLEAAWRQGIRWHLRNKRKVNKDVVFITHVGCTVKQIEWVKAEVLKRVPFDYVIVQKSSFSNACNSGMHTIGISYYSNW